MEQKRQLQADMHAERATLEAQLSTVKTQLATASERAAADLRDGIAMCQEQCQAEAAQHLKTELQRQVSCSPRHSYLSFC